MNTDLALDSASREAAAYINAELLGIADGWIFWVQMTGTKAKTEIKFSLDHLYKSNVKVEGTSLRAVVAEFKRRMDFDIGQIPNVVRVELAPPVDTMIEGNPAIPF